MFAVNGCQFLVFGCSIQETRLQIYFPLLPGSQLLVSLLFQLSDYSGPVLSSISFKKGWLLSVPFRVVPRKVKDVHVCSLGLLRSLYLMQLYN